jgi:hypothetical protein
LDVKEIVGSERFEDLQEPRFVCWEKEQFTPEAFGKSDILIKLDL